MKTPHKHAELIKAWADGAEIEYRVKDGTLGWSNWKSFKDLERFLTDPWWDYRIKPEPKPDTKYWLRTYEHSGGSIFTPHLLSPTEVQPANIKLTFDGETGKLKAAEVL